MTSVVVRGFDVVTWTPGQQRCVPQPPAGFVVLANRLPIDRVSQPDGSIEWRPSAGGLVTALDPIVTSHQVREQASASGDSIWIGCATGAHMKTGRALPAPETYKGIRLCEVELSPRERAEYYDGFANSTLWPLYHDMVERPEFRKEWWQTYVAVNDRFARYAAQLAAPGAVMWVHDYHLQLVPRMVRTLRPDVRIGFFLHTPVPEVEIFRRLPQRAEILLGLCGADLIGFQRPRAAAAFRRLLHEILGFRPTRAEVDVGGRVMRIGSFSTAVDSAAIQTIAKSVVGGSAVGRIRNQLGEPGTLIASVERVDYTKGIEQRLAAFAGLLARGKLRSADTVLLQVLPASRQHIPGYRALRGRIVRLIEQINTTYGRPGHPVVVHWERAHTREELIPLYLAIDVMAVTPLRDGMNLVAKEYVTARIDDGGALVLSEFAGAAEELVDAYLVNPFDEIDLQETMYQAVHATNDERIRRMCLMRSCLSQEDAHSWVRSFLRCLVE